MRDKKVPAGTGISLWPKLRDVYSKEKLKCIKLSLWIKETQLETPRVQVSSFKYTGNYNMILQMQTQVDNQVKTMISHITEDHIHQMSSHINTKCENGAYHQNPGPGQH